MRYIILTSLLVFLCSTTIQAQDEAPPGIEWLHDYVSDDIGGRMHAFFDVFMLQAGYAMTGYVVPDDGGSFRGWLVVADEGGEPVLNNVYLSPDNDALSIYGGA